MTVPKLRGYAAFAEIAAQPAELWRWLTEPALLLRWYAAAIQLDLQAGGRLVARYTDGHTVQARIAHHDSVRRLGLVFYPDATWPGTAVISEDWIIDARPGKVMLRVLGEGVPVAPAWAPWLRLQQARWTVSLAQLKQAVGPARAG